jgi:hypothetical protein
MKISFYLVGLLFLATTFGSCKKQNEQVNLKPGLITSFSLSKSLNPNIISLDVQAIIKENEISIDIPKDIDISRLIVSFTFEGKKIHINGVVQKSEATINDFSQPIVYQVIGDDDKTVNYTIKINQITDEELLLTSFSFDKATNTDLLSNFNFSFKADSVIANIPTLANKTYIPSFVTTAKEVLINNVSIKNGLNLIDFSKPVSLSLISAKGFKKNYVIKVNWQSVLPHIYIQTTNNAPIISKDNYLTATLTIDGKGGYSDINTSTAIKGRGNSTWGYPKKPYRLKLDSKTSLFGLPKAKNWVLLANYLDGTLMLNSVALKAGQLLNLPYTNNFVPVDVSINGKYVGCYLFTEQVEVSENRVSIEDGGTLLELDSYFDEDYKFKSANYQLPVNIKYPEPTAQTSVTAIQQEFQGLENLIFDHTFPNNNYLDYLDKDILVNFLIVANLTDNEELSHPKSTYIYKPKNGKYCMGPIWDFDWAYGYEGTSVHFSSATRPLFSVNTSTRPGNKFFTRLLQDPTIKLLYKQKWAAFKVNKLPILLQFVDDYALQITQSKEKDYALWKTGSANFTTDVAKLRQYLVNRATYIDNYVAAL